MAEKASPISKISPKEIATKPNAIAIKSFMVKPFPICLMR